MRLEQVTIPAIRCLLKKPKLAEFIFSKDPWGNPFGESMAEDPYPKLEDMRVGGPIVYRKLYQQWFVTGYDEAKAVLSSPSLTTTNPIETLLEVRPYSQLSDRSKEYLASWLLLIDPPDHTRLRKLVAKAFTSTRMEELRPAVGKITDRLLEALPETSEVEVQQTFCTKLPVEVIATMLGLPEERWEWSRKVTVETTKLVDPYGGFDPNVMDNTIDQIFDYYNELVEDRIRDPQDDLISALAEASDGQDRLSRHEIITLISFLMGAGHETTANLLGNAIIALANHPEQRAMVYQNPDLWPNAVEELLRFDTSVRLSIRSTTEPLEVAGTLIPKEANILVQLSAANRDPKKYQNPNQLLVDREKPNPLSFGSGIHYCLGAALARIELHVGLQKFLDAFGHYTVDDKQTVWKRSASLRGPTRLVVKRGEPFG